MRLPGKRQRIAPVPAVGPPDAMASLIAQRTRIARVYTPVMCAVWAPILALVAWRVFAGSDMDPALRVALVVGVLGGWVVALVRRPALLRTRGVRLVDVTEGAESTSTLRGRFADGTAKGTLVVAQVPGAPRDVAQGDQALVSIDRSGSIVVLQLDPRVLVQHGVTPSHPPSGAA